ncbi:MAG: hypothetical protein FRX49_13239 [Trebouxia sp. A1-2]|nr:MAG: hypothetical protein FRX49_13239 [Trebouxia sp. A1-2]
MKQECLNDDQVGSFSNTDVQSAPSREPEVHPGLQSITACATAIPQAALNALEEEADGVRVAPLPQLALVDIDTATDEVKVGPLSRVGSSLHHLQQLLDDHSKPVLLKAVVGHRDHLFDDLFWPLCCGYFHVGGMGDGVGAGICEVVGGDSGGDRGVSLGLGQGDTTILLYMRRGIIAQDFWVMGVKASPAMPMWSPDERLAGTARFPVVRGTWMSVEAMPLDTVGVGPRGDLGVGLPGAAP